MNRKINETLVCTTISYNLKHLVNPFPNDRILDMTKLKAFADDKLNVAKMMNHLLNWKENTVGKEKMLVTSNFSFSHSVFKTLVP